MRKIFLFILFFLTTSCKFTNTSTSSNTKQSWTKEEKDLIISTIGEELPYFLSDNSYNLSIKEETKIEITFASTAWSTICKDFSAFGAMFIENNTIGFYYGTTSIINIATTSQNTTFILTLYSTPLLAYPATAMSDWGLYYGAIQERTLATLLPLPPLSVDTNTTIVDAYYGVFEYTEIFVNDYRHTYGKVLANEAYKLVAIDNDDGYEFIKSTLEGDLHIILYYNNVRNYMTIVAFWTVADEIIYDTAPITKWDDFMAQKMIEELGEEIPVAPFSKYYYHNFPFVDTEGFIFYDYPRNQENSFIEEYTAILLEADYKYEKTIDGWPVFVKGDIVITFGFNTTYQANDINVYLQETPKPGDEYTPITAWNPELLDLMDINLGKRIPLAALGEDYTYTINKGLIKMESSCPDITSDYKEALLDQNYRLVREGIANSIYHYVFVDSEDSQLYIDFYYDDFYKIMVIETYRLDYTPLAAWSQSDINKFTEALHGYIPDVAPLSPLYELYKSPNYIYIMDSKCGDIRDSYALILLQSSFVHQRDYEDFGDQFSVYLLTTLEYTIEVELIYNAAINNFSIGFAYKSI